MLVSTTIGTLVAQEMTKPKPFLDAPKPSPKSRMVGFGRTQGEVERPLKIEAQPLVHGKQPDGPAARV
jgi:hypothetical protein